MSVTCEMYLASEGGLGNLGAIKNSTKEELYRRLLIARNFINANITSQITLEGVASEACLSKFHFMRLFKQAFGQTVHQYITQQRLKQTRHLLESKQMQFSEICRSMGYEDVAWFAKVYKKAFGVSPVRQSKLSPMQVAHREQARAVA